MKTHVFEGLGGDCFGLLYCVKTLENYIFEESLLVWVAVTRASKGFVTVAIAGYAVIAVRVAVAAEELLFTTVTRDAVIA